MRHTLVLFGIVTMAVRMFGDEPCADCAKAAFPQAAERLAALGYPEDRFTVLVAWEEAAPADRHQVFGGYHVLSKADGSAFDLYVDTDGIRVGAARLAALGIGAKDWNLKPRAVPMAMARKAAKAAPLVPVPTGTSPSVVVALPAIDRAAVEEEDAQGTAVPQKGVTRIGVFQELDAPLHLTETSASAGAWQERTDGSRVWAGEVYSPDARGLRVHFADIVLPAGVEVVVYNASSPSEAYGPYTGPNMDETDLWAASCFGERVVVECRVPAGATAKTLNVTVDQVIYIYRAFDTLAWAKSAGLCNLDVSCYPAWADAATAVGGIGTVGTAGYLWCTGSLLVDTDPSTDTPYFITANHCVSSQSGSRGASTIEVYWLYQTDTCGGTVPSASSVPRTTGGAYYLAGSAGNSTEGGGTDFTLMRLYNAPPSGIGYLGWSTKAPSVGSAITCIHHPYGDYKRISFGALTNSGNSWPALFHQVVYGEGTTERGSSGCPLILDATGQFIGQLYGGSAACSYLEGPDYYGRFDVTFPIVQGYLDSVSVTPQADFGATSYTAGESDGTVSVEVVLSAPPGATPASLHYATSDGTAVAGRDYQAASGTLVFDGTLQSKRFTITINSDTHADGDGTVLLTLSNPVGCALASSGNNPVTLTILDDDMDSDGDGLSDYDELNAVYGYVTDPYAADSDDDGRTDYEEELGLPLGLYSDPNEYSPLPALAVPYFVDAPRACRARPAFPSMWR